MNTRSIWLYLSWNYYWNYIVPYDKLIIIELIRLYCECDVSDLFKIIDSKDFYSMALNKAQRTNLWWFYLIIEKLKIPDFIKYYK